MARQSRQSLKISAAMLDMFAAIRERCARIMGKKRSRNVLTRYSAVFSRVPGSAGRQ